MDWNLPLVLEETVESDESVFAQKVTDDACSSPHAYYCVDGLGVQVPRTAAVGDASANPANVVIRGDRECVLPAPRSGILYTWGRDSLHPSPRLFVSGTEFSRSMKELVRGAAGARTVCAPTTVEAVRSCAYQDAEALRTVVLDARGASLERIGNRCF